MKTKITVITTLSILLAVTVPNAFAAEEYVVTGNGSESENSVNISNNSQTTVQQNNNTNIQNNVSTTSDTGNNSASDNTGGSAGIQTGDATTATTVTNQGNVNTATQNNCCNQVGSTAVVSGNGTGSNNNISINDSSSTNIMSNNNASITNNISIQANTGRNKANGNVGDVFIKTGDIKAYQEVINGPLNINNVTFGANGNKERNIIIKGNGSYSENTITIFDNEEFKVRVNNVADIINNVFTDLNTGENEANGNVGDVTISTGDIISKTVISNAVNYNKVDLSCVCEKEKEKAAPVTIPTKQETSAAPAPAGGIGGAPAPAQVLGASVGQVLPITGNNLLLLLIIGNIVMMFMGMYLRLRSGRSPGTMYAF
jgi:hypothetical protein